MKTASLFSAGLACALLLSLTAESQAQHEAVGPGRYRFAVLAGAPGTKGYVDGLGSAARFDNPGGMAADAAGNVYLSERDLSVIRKISPEGAVSTFAGAAGQRGSQDGPGAAARFNNPSGLAVDRAGNVYVVDTGNHTIRKIDRAGNVTTYAGKAGESGRIDGAKEIARLGSPTCLTVDDAGNVFLYDQTSPLFDRRWLRKITSEGTVSSLTISPNMFIAVQQLCVDPSGNLYAAIRESGPFWDLTNVHRLTPTSEAGHYSAAFFNPPWGASWITGIGSDEKGRLFVRGPGGYTTNAYPTFVYTPAAGWEVRDHPGSPSASRDWEDLESYDHVAVSRSGKFYLFRNDSSSRGDPRGAVEVEVFDPDPAVPEILRQPRSQAIAMGRTVAFNLATTGAPAPTLQWTKDGIALAGATDATLILTPTSAADAGTYRCIATNRAGSVTSDPATLSIAGAAEGSRIGGFSVRADLCAAARLVAGFVVSGGSKPMLLRAVGPGLRPFLSPATALEADPRLELYNATGALVQANDDWGGDAAMARAFASAGAFPLANDSRDAALLRSFNGAHTAHVFGNSSGMVLFEAYDAGGETTSRLVNLSARSRVFDRDGTLIAGIVIAGASSQTVLVRGLGPALASFGVNHGLPDPKLEVFDAANLRLADNDDWSVGLAATAAQVGAFALPIGNRDAAVLLSLPPGSYTAVLSGVGGATGEALIEVYEVP